jgi:TIR domain
LASVFISYRRDDTAGHAGRLAHDLIERFGRDSVFMDIDAISPGVDFEQRIHEALSACDVVLVLIGDEWTSLRTPDGRRRLDDDEDFVRKEVTAALGRDDLTVIPVLVEGVEMPPPGELPDEISALARRHAFELSNSRWDFDVGRLATVIEESEQRGPVGRLARRARRRWRPVAAVAGLAAAAAAGVVLASGGGGGTKKVDPAAKVAACQRAHGMSRAEQVRDTRAGESQVEAPPGENQALSQKTYEACTWPPRPGADPDGYGTIVATAANGPDTTEASGRDFADRVESPCGRLQLAYSFGSMGRFDRLPPFTAKQGEIWAPKAGGFEPIANSGLLNLPFTPLRNEVTVLRNATLRLDGVRCLA